MEQTPQLKIDKTEQTLGVLSETLLRAERLLEHAEAKVEHTIVPLQKSFWHRFPALFLLTVTFGVTTTALGIEQLLLRFEVLNQNPILLFMIGITTLIVTGRLYKKLG